MLTLQIIATVFLGLGILKSVIKCLGDCEETTLGYIIGYFVGILLVQLPKVFIIVVIWLKWGGNMGKNSVNEIVEKLKKHDIEIV